MTLPIVPLQPIERGQLNVMRARGAGMALALILPACIAEFAIADRLPVHGAIAGLALLPGIWLAIVAPPRRWRHWSYAFTGTELHVAHGWWTRVHTIVPVVRVQHIDVAQGPLERSFGVARLVLHTAGSDNTIVTLPGVARATAEEIRDAIRARIGSAA
jgi:membrane protein YdbS with pleckstrin-like domain